MLVSYHLPIDLYLQMSKLSEDKSVCHFMQRMKHKIIHMHKKEFKLCQMWYLFYILFLCQFACWFCFVFLSAYDCMLTLSSETYLQNTLTRIGFATGMSTIEAPDI